MSNVPPDNPPPHNIDSIFNELILLLLRDEEKRSTLAALLADVDRSEGGQ